LEIYVEIKIVVIEIFWKFRKRRKKIMSAINNNGIVPDVLNNRVLRDQQNHINETRNRVRGKEAEVDENRKEMLAARERRSEARFAITQAEMNNRSNLFSYMSNSFTNNRNETWGSGTFDSDVFYGSGSELSNLQAMNSARIGIENRARSLIGEIGRDRARGIDVSDRQEALSNLTGNLDILSRNLNSSIDRALADDNREGRFIDMVTRLREANAPPKAEEAAKPEEAPKPEESSAKDNPPAVPAPDVPDTEEASSAPSSAAALAEAVEDSNQPEFAPPPAFDGNVAEQVSQAAEEQPEDEMSIAAQIANNAQSDYAESNNILDE